MLLKCNPNEKEGIFKVREDKYQDDYVSEDRTNNAKSFCLRDRGRLKHRGWPIFLEIHTRSSYAELCKMQKFQLHYSFSIGVLDISPRVVL